jgi:hypothetical protein
MRQKLNYPNFTIKGKTNGDDLCKQIVIFVDNPEDGHEPFIIIRRLILVAESNLMDCLETDHKVLRKFRGKYLVFKSFSIKVSTFQTINEWINSVK